MIANWVQRFKREAPVRKKLVVQRRRGDRACKGAAGANETFCGEEEQGSGAPGVFLCRKQKKTSEQSALCSDVVRISTLNLKKVKGALACHNSIARILSGSDTPPNRPADNPPDYVGTKLVNSLSVQQVILSEEQKAQAELMYRDGQTMSAIAKAFGCHYTTIGRILRRRKVPIREKL